MAGPRLSLTFDWDVADPQGTAFSATAGQCVLMLGSTRIWGTDSEGIHWTWVDLLAFLAENWIALLHEPIPASLIRVDTPNQLRREAERDWDDHRRSGAMTEAQFLDEEEGLFWFEERHDLSRAIQGKVVPDLIIVRDGPQFAVSSKSGPTEFLSYGEVVRCLEEAGDQIAGRLDGLDDPVAVARRTEWQCRWPQIDLGIVRLSTGAPEDYLREIAAEANLLEFWGEGVSTIQDNLPMAAARMGNSARLSARSVKTILHLVKSRHARPSHTLAQLNRAATAFLPEHRDEKPAEQGRKLAAWYRSRINRPSGKIEPRDLMDSLNIEIVDVSLRENDVDALCCWHQGERPIILLNISSNRNRRKSGQRAALAHELCHVIADYDAAIPFAEVIIGTSRDRLEQRARGFAAELLMPRCEIARWFQKDEPMAVFVDRLADSFDVSQEIVAWQIWRSEIMRTEADRQVLRRFVSNSAGLDD